MFSWLLLSFELLMALVWLNVAYQTHMRRGFASIRRMDDLYYQKMMRKTKGRYFDHTWENSPAMNAPLMENFLLRSFFFFNPYKNLPVWLKRKMKDTEWKTYYKPNRKVTEQQIRFWSNRKPMKRVNWSKVTDILADSKSARMFFIDQCRYRTKNYPWSLR